MAALSFALACTTGKTETTSSGTSSQPASAAGFSTSSLKGNYVYRLAGNYFNLQSGDGPYERAGTFIADGNGNITSGVDDFVQSSAPSSNPIVGNYAISSDGTGKLTINLGNSQLIFAITMVADGTVYLIEFDTTATGAGVAVLQDASAFQPPTGTFAFRFHSNQANIPSQGSVSRVGTMAVTSKGSVAGSEDIVRVNALSSLTLTGSLSAPDSTGKGTAIFSDSAGFTLNYFYYVIDSNTLTFLETDEGPLGDGRAEMQTGAPFSDSSLSNVFVFHSLGETETTLDGVNSVGALHSDGKGNVTLGSYDSVQDGVPTVNASLSGTYSIDSSGRAVIDLTPQGSTTIEFIAWMVSPSRAFFLVNVAGLAEDGAMDQQQTITAGSLNGQYSILMYGHDQQTPPLVDRVGVITLNGSSVITLTDYFINRNGSRNQISTDPVGTYNLGANGRLSASITGVTSAMVLYMTSNNSGYLILEDTGEDVSGSIALQVTP